jgi:hypothetical protein
MSLLLLFSQDAPGQSAPRDLMRSSGIRRPWMPRPLGGFPDRIAHLATAVVVASTLATPLLPQGQVWAPRPLDPGVVAPQEKLSPVQLYVNNPAPPQARNILLGMVPRVANTDPLRPTLAQWPPVPVPGAVVWAPQPARDPNTDPRHPTVLISGQQPQPQPSLWKPEAARAPNVDPLRPPIVQDAPPDATLAHPDTTWAGRLPRDEDTTRPARPAIVQGVPVPIPGAALWLPTPAHETPVAPTERIAVAPVTILGQQPVPGANAIWVPRSPRDEDRQWPARMAIVARGLQPIPDAAALPIGRLPRPEDTSRPARPAIVQGVPLPIPGATTWLGTPPHETPGAQPDRLPIATTPAIPGAQPVPRAVVVQLGRITPPAAERVPLRSPIVEATSGRAPPAGQVTWIRVVREGAAPPTPIICAVALLTHEPKPHAVVGQQRKAAAHVAPAPRTALLTHEPNAIAALTQHVKPVASLEQC